MCQYRGTVFTTQTPRRWFALVRSTRKKIELELWLKALDSSEKASGRPLSGRGSRLDAMEPTL